MERQCGRCSWQLKSREELKTVSHTSRLVKHMHTVQSNESTKTELYTKKKLCI